MKTRDKTTANKIKTPEDESTADKIKMPEGKTSTADKIKTPEGKTSDVNNIKTPEGKTSAANNIKTPDGKTSDVDLKTIDEKSDASDNAASGNKNTAASVKKVCGIALNVGLWLILAVSLLLMLFSVFATISGGRRTLLGIGLYQIVSGSMQPEIMVGDVVVAKNAGIEDLKAGDNVVFVYGDILVVHKVQEIHSGYIVTKGVANTSTERVAAADIVGKQAFVIPKLGYALDFLRSGFGFALIIALPLGGIIIWQTVTLGKRLSEYRKQQALSKEEQAEQQTLIKEEIASLKLRLEKQSQQDESDSGAELFGADTESGGRLDGASKKIGSKTGGKQTQNGETGKENTLKDKQG